MEKEAKEISDSSREYSGGGISINVIIIAAIALLVLVVLSVLLLRSGVPKTTNEIDIRFENNENIGFDPYKGNNFMCVSSNKCENIIIKNSKFIGNDWVAFFNGSNFIVDGHIFEGDSDYFWNVPNIDSEGNLLEEKKSNSDQLKDMVEKFGDPMNPKVKEGMMP